VEQDFGRTPGQTGSSDRGGEAKEQARQQTQQFAQQARQQAGELANRGNEQVKSQLANQKHDASQRMVPIQSALRETAQQLRKQGQGSTAQYADKASDQVERFSGYLRETDVDEIVDEVRGFARRRPALFLGSAAALGFFATRFLKSSSEEEGASVGNVPPDTPPPPREEPPPGEERPERRAAAAPTTPPTGREEPPPGEERPGRRTP
jgi:hypothetical protein